MSSYVLQLATAFFKLFKDFAKFRILEKLRTHCRTKLIIVDVHLGLMDMRSHDTFIF